MPLEEQASTSRRALNYSPSRTSSRIYGQTSSKRQHKAASAVPKPPEPLRRAVADCLSAATNGLLPSESSRTLREYLANPSSTDLAYSLLIEHTLAERDRSPAVVPRCVALLKTYLLRYIPKTQTLRQIDQFCENSINACHSALNPTESLWSKSLSQQYEAPSGASHTIPPFKHASNFASPSLVKSLSYVRSLVARHIPKLSFQSLAKTSSSTSTKQLLPTLSSLLSKTLSSHISPEDVSNRECPQKKENILQSSLSESDGLDKVAGGDCSRSVSVDLLTWRWSIKKEHQSSFFTRESDARSHLFLEVGAAALFIGDVEAKAKEQNWNHNRDQDLPDIDQLLHPSSATTASNFASSHSHLKAITASKRLKPGPHHTWANVPVSTYHPRARPLFQYRHYSEQQPLRLNLSEISEVITEACSDSASSNASLMNASPQLTNVNRRPPTEVAVSVLLKLVIDMYMMDSATAAPLALSMLEDILSSEKVASRVRVFDIILNLGVHAHLLEPVLHEDPLTVDEDEEAFHDELSLNSEKIKTMQEKMASAIDKFETWLLVILFEILQFLVQTEEQEEIVWASALSCLFFFVCDGGKILRSRLNGLDIRVIKALLEISRKHSWAEIVHCRLICMLANMFYLSPHNSGKNGSETSHDYEEAVSEFPHNNYEESLSQNSIFLVEQVDILGGIDFICLEYSQAYTRDEKRNLFLVLFDYVVHQINEVCLTSGISVYTYNEIQPIASLLSLANAPEAFYIAVKHGVQGIGEILRKPISSAMSRSPNYERLDMLLEKVTNKIDATINAFTCLNNEFSYMIQITKSYKYVKSIEEGLGESDGSNVTLSWATLHSLLHSERSAYHRNGYVWLAELLLCEVTEDRQRSIWENIKKLQENIVQAGSQDLSFSTAPLSVCMLCGLLKSKHNYIRWGFLFVLDELLMRLKLLLDESETDGTSNQSESRLKKANAVIDVMSNALLLVVQINETDRINILKMCDIIFSQLCLRLQSPTTKNDDSNLLYGTPSMAALLLRGHAIVPMQLVARVPESLFYWPLIQLARAATDDIALDVAVGSEGGGNLPGATSDIRAALLLLLIGKCSADSMAFMEIEGEEFFRGLLDDTDSRVAYYSSAFLLKRMMTNQPENYQRMLQDLILKAQQSNNEKLLENPYLQMRGILKLLNDSGS